MENIRQILKKGAKLKARKLDPNDKEVKGLIEETCKQQERVLALKKIDWRELKNQIITI